MAPSTRASERAGRRARARRRGLTLTPEGPPIPVRASTDTSADPGERGMDQPLLGRLAPDQFVDDGAVAKDIDVIAVLQLVRLRRVPKERAARARLLVNEAVDLELGAEV